MPPKKRIELEPEEPEIPEEEPPKVELDIKPKGGRPAGKKDEKPRKMTMSKLESLKKAQEARRANLLKKKQQQTIEEPKPADIESYDEIIENIPEKKQVKPKEEDLITQKSEPIKKQKRKIVIVKEPESDSDESLEIKYVKPKKKSKPKKTYEDDDEEEENYKPNALELLLKHYGGF